MAQDRLGDLDHVAREPPRDRGRRARIAGDLLRDRDARCEIDGVDQAQHQLGVVALFLGGVRGLLHVKIGEHAHQRRADIDAVAAREAVETLQAWETSQTRMTSGRPAADKSSRGSAYARPR